MIKTDYHELPRVTKPTYMIYSLINLDNGKRYIGRTHSPRGRIMNHFYGIKKHEHVNEFLNQDSNCRFGYEILEENVTKKNAKEREVYYMIFFKTYDQKFGYNVNDPMMNIMTKNVNKGHKERKDYESYRNYVCLQTERKSSCAHA